MRKLIKKLLRESLLSEAALTASDLPKGTGLFYKEGDSDELVLFNPKVKSVVVDEEGETVEVTGKVYAIINFVEYEQLGFYSVISVAADKGYGPLIYELAMMCVNKKQKSSMLTPTRSGAVRDEAFNVWEKMYKRGDVKKETLKPTDKGFRYDILFPTSEVEDDDDERQKAFDELLDNEKEALIVFNSGYTMKPNTDYEALLEIAQQYDEDTKKLASFLGHEFWGSSY